MNNHSDRLHSALKWITGIFDRLDIPFQIVGGLAAKCYGSTRPLHDIDLYVPNEGISKLVPELKEYLEFGPEHYRGEFWDLVYMKLRYNGQQIEIGDADQSKYYDSQSQQWIPAEIDFSEAEIIEFVGIELPVMPKQELIQYKQRLDRRVDRIDIREMQYHP